MAGRPASVPRDNSADAIGYASSIRIRRATTGDAPFIERVHRDSIRGIRHPVYSRADLESWASGLYPDRYRRAMDEFRERVLLAEAVGHGAVAFCSWQGGEVMGLYVVPSFAGRGLAGRLLGMAESEIARSGHREVTLGAGLSALSFYERCGYRVIRRRGWRTRGGLVVPVADMAKPLTPARAS